MTGQASQNEENSVENARAKSTPDFGGVSNHTPIGGGAKLRENSEGRAPAVQEVCLPLQVQWEDVQFVHQGKGPRQQVVVLHPDQE